MCPGRAGLLAMMRRAGLWEFCMNYFDCLPSGPPNPILWLITAPLTDIKSIKYCFRVKGKNVQKFR